MNLTLQQFESISRVMYEPLHYIDSDYPSLATINDDIVWQKLANRQLIKHYNLITEIDCNIETDDIVQKLFQHWSLLPQCALFLGYFYSPESILNTDDYYQLSLPLQAFLSLSPVILIDKDNKNNNDNITPTILGYQILLAFIRSFSEALAQRFKLCFPTKQTQIILSSPLYLSRSLFLLVLNYAALSI